MFRLKMLLQHRQTVTIALQLLLAHQPNVAKTRVFNMNQKSEGPDKFSKMLLLTPRKLYSYVSNAQIQRYTNTVVNIVNIVNIVNSINIVNSVNSVNIVNIVKIMKYLEIPENFEIPECYEIP